MVIFRVSIHGINELAGVACASPKLCYTKVVQTVQQ